MTGVTRWNKTISKAGADGWNLTTDDGRGFDSANVVVPVASQAERDGLTPPVTGKYAGMVVARTDIAGIPFEKYDGSAWIRQPIVDTSPITNDGNWTISGGLQRTITTGLTQVTASWKMTRTAAAINILTTDSTVIVGAIPSGFRPTWNSSVVVTVNDNVGGRYAEPQLIVNTGGSIVARSTSGGGITIGVGYTIFVSVVWCI